MSNNFRKYGGINRNARIQNVKTDKIYTNILNAKNLQITNADLLDVFVDETLTLKDEVIFNNVSQPSLIQHMGRIVGIQDATIGQEREGLIIESANINHPGITNQYIKFAKYGSNGDNPVMIWDLSAHNVGINLGNTLPQATLHIKTDDTQYPTTMIENTYTGLQGITTLLLQGHGRVNTTLSLEPTNTSYGSMTLKAQDTNNRFVYREQNLQFDVDDTGTNTMTLTTNRNVGIGTTTPQAKLDVNGNIRVNNGLSDGPINGEMGGDGSRIVLWSGNATNTPFALGIGSSSLWYGVPTSGNHIWYNGTTEAMRISSGRNVGINVTIPQTKLHIRGSSFNEELFRIENGTTGNEATFSVGTNQVNPTEPGDNAYLKMRDGYGIERVNINLIGDSYLNTAGNIGIGTTTPQAKLDVNGTMQVSGMTTIANRLNVLNNVGIGTNNPGFELHIVDPIYARMCLQSLSGENRIQQELIFKTHQSARGGGIFWQDTSDPSRNSFFGRPYNDGSPTPGIIYNSTTTAEQIIGSRAGLAQVGPYKEPMLSILDDTGNVGLGIGFPQERLDVSGNIQSNKLLNKSTIETINYTDPSFVNNLSIRTYETTNHNEYCLHMHSNRPIYVDKPTPSDVSFTIDFQLLDYTNASLFRASCFPPTADILVYLSEYSSDTPNNGRITGQTNAQFIYTVNLGNVANVSDPTKDISYTPIAIQNIEDTLFSNLYIETSSTYDATLGHWISRNVLHYTRYPTAGQYGDIQIQFRLRHNPFSNGRTNPNITLKTDTTGIVFYET